MGTINRYMATLFSISKEHRARYNINSKEDLKKMSRSIFDFQATVESKDVVIKSEDKGGSAQASTTEEADKTFMDSDRVEALIRERTDNMDSDKVVSLISTHSSGGGLTTYQNLDALPTSSLTSGDQAWIESSGRLYISNGTGWYNIALLNLSPQFDSSIDAAYTLDDSTSSLSISVPASDSDNADNSLIYAYEWSDIGDSADYIFRVAQDSAKSSDFTITPMGYDSAEANVAAGHIDSNSSSIGITFKASDGVSQASLSTTINYTWAGFAGFDLPNNTFTFYGHTGNYNRNSSVYSDGGIGLRNGPDLARLKTNYSSHAWTQVAQNFWVPTKTVNGTSLDGYQTFRAPKDGNYTFDVYGAAGANGSPDGGLNNPQRGGLGARMRARINNVSRGDYFQVIVGHSANPNTNRAGSGGGGSFVLYKPATDWTAAGIVNGFTTSDLVIAAGGGGGGGRDPYSGNHQEGVNANTYQYTSTAPGTHHRYKVNGGSSANSRTAGTNGNAPDGTNGPWGGGDGAGFKENAQYYAGQASPAETAKGYADGLIGGRGYTGYGLHGAFGGGGGSTWGSGGGGGYSGGSGDYSNGTGPSSNNDNSRGGGGGGGSYINTSKASVLTVTNSSHYARSGYVIMTIS